MKAGCSVSRTSKFLTFAKTENKLLFMISRWVHPFFRFLLMKTKRQLMLKIFYVAFVNVFFCLQSSDVFVFEMLRCVCFCNLVFSNGFICICKLFQTTSIGFRLGFKVLNKGSLKECKTNARVVFIRLICFSAYKRHNTACGHDCMQPARRHRKAGYNRWRAYA